MKCKCRRAKFKAIMKGAFRLSILPLKTGGSLKNFDKQKSDKDAHLLTSLIKSFGLLLYFEKKQITRTPLPFPTQVYLFLQTDVNAFKETDSQ